MGPREAMGMLRGQEHLCYGDRLSKLVLQEVSVLEGPNRKGGEGLFSRECSDRARGNIFKP